MMKIVKWLAQKPEDSTVRLQKIIFWSLLILLSYYNLIYLGKSLETEFFWIAVNDSFIMGVKYFLVLIGCIPLIAWALDVCILKSKYMRIVQIVLWIILIYLSTKIQETPKLDFDIILFFAGFFPIFMGITGKCITKKCQRFAEKVQKIRV